MKIVSDGRYKPERRPLSPSVGICGADLHGHSLRDGLRRRKKLDALAKRLRDPIASRIDPQAYAHDRRVRMEAGASPEDAQQ